MGKLRDGRKGDAMIAADAVQDRAGAAPGVTRRTVDDPMLTPAQLAHQVRLKGHEGGKVEVDIRLASLIGGLCRMARTRPMEEAAARYRGLWERAQIGGARALDYGAVRVDTSGASEAAVWERGEDARRAYLAANAALAAGGGGDGLARIVQHVICHEMSVRAAARALGWGGGGAAQARVGRLLLAALGTLALHFGLAGEARQGGRMRREGQVASDWSVDGEAAA